MTGSAENFASPGRPEVYSERYKRELDRVSLKNNDQSLRGLANDRMMNLEEASKDTIQRSLTSHDIRTVVMPKRLDLIDY